jgi:hypothetical protein
MHNPLIQTVLIQALVDDVHRAAARASYQRSVGPADRAVPMPGRAAGELIARWITARPIRTHP